MKYIDADKLKAEIKRYKNKADNRLKIKGRTISEDVKDLALQNLCGNLLHFIGSLQQEQLIYSNLDEAAEDFVWEVMENDEDGISELSRKLRPSSKITDFYDALAEFFKTGAEWMIEKVIAWLKENGHKYIYDAEINRGEDCKVDLRISEKCFEDLRKAIK